MLILGFGKSLKVVGGSFPLKDTLVLLVSDIADKHVITSFGEGEGRE